MIQEEEGGDGGLGNVGEGEWGVKLFFSVEMGKTAMGFILVANCIVCSFHRFHSMNVCPEVWCI